MMVFESDPNSTKSVHRSIRYCAMILVALAACRDTRDDAAGSDSALARDITLASTVAQPTPQLRDTPDSTTPVEQPLPEPKVERPRAPTRTRTATQPKPVTPPPAPSPTPPAVETATPTPAPA